MGDLLKNKIMDSTITSILAATGFATLFSGLLIAYFQSKFNQKTQAFQKQQELRQSRYLSILMQMLAKLDPENHLTKINKVRPDLASIKDLDSELLTELLNSFVFADDAVITSLATFINEPNYKHYIQTAIAMRSDLWGKKSKISEQTLQEFTVFRKLLNK